MSDQNNDLPAPASAGDGTVPDAQPDAAESPSAAPASPNYQAPAATPPSYPAPSSPAPSYAPPTAAPGAYPAYTAPPAGPAYPPQYQGAPAYGAPPVYTPYPTGPKTNPLAVVSLVASIVGLVLFPFVGSITGIITGHISLKQIRTREEGGRGMALAGTIVGYAGFALYAVFVVLFVLWIVWISSLGNAAYYDYSYSS